MIRKIIHTTLTKFLSSGIGFLTIILISQCLGPSGKGEQSIFLFNVFLLQLILTSIGNSTLIYLGPRHSFRQLFIPSFLWVLMITGIMAIIATRFNTPIISHHTELFTIGFMAAITEINYYILLSKEEVGKANNLRLIWQVISILILIGLAITKGLNSIEHYILSLIIGYSISLIYGVFLLRKEYKTLRFISLKELGSMFKLLAKLGGVKQIGSIAQILNARVMFHLIRIYVGSKSLGIFSNGVSITEAVLMLGTSMALVQYSRLSNVSDEEYSKDITIKMTKANLAFSSLFLLVFIFLPDEFYQFVFGRDFSGISFIIRLLAIGYLLISFTTTFTQYFASKGNFKITTSASLLGLISTFGLGFWLVPSYGITGAGITMTISYLITFIVEYYYFKKWTGARIKDFLITREDIKEAWNRVFK